MLRKTLATPTLALVLATSTLLYGCGDSPDTPDASRIDAMKPGGTFSLAWSIVNGGSPISCTDVGAVAVSIILIPQGSASGEAESFPCASGQASSRNFTPGTYDISIDIRAAGSRSLLPARVRIDGIEIKLNEETALPAQEFSIEPIGDFHFVVDTGATAGNCAPTDSDGGGLIGLAFALKNSADVCVPTEFVIADGSEPGGTYTNDCVTVPAAFPCIGSDQQVSVAGATSGALSLQITGQKGPVEAPVDCYDRVSNFDLPGAGLVKDLGSLLLALEYSIECDPDFMFPDGGMLFDAGP